MGVTPMAVETLEISTGLICKGDGNRQVPETIASAKVQIELVAPMLHVEVKSLADLSINSFLAIAFKSNPPGFSHALKRRVLCSLLGGRCRNPDKVLEIYRTQKEEIHPFVVYCTGMVVTRDSPSPPSQ